METNKDRKETYVMPEVKIYDLNISKIICQSGNVDDYTNEEFNW